MPWPNFRRDQYLTVLLISTMLLLGHGSLRSLAPQSVALPLAEVKLLPMAPIPVPTTSSESSASASILKLPLLTAESALVIDLPSASILFEKASRLYQPPASTAKLMTVIVALETYDEQQLFTVGEEAQAVGTTAELDAGTVLTLTDVLKAALIQSGNDAAFLLANNHPEGYQKYVEQMNNKAQALHLHQTTFTNPSGLDNEQQLTTAFDLSLVGREILKQPLLANIVATPVAVVRDQTTGTEYQLYNTNRLLHEDNHYRGIKTGTTTEAGEVLVSYYQEGDRKLLIVIMQSQDRYQDTQRLAEWSLANYQWLTPVNP